MADPRRPQPGRYQRWEPDNNPWAESELRRQYDAWKAEQSGDRDPRGRMSDADRMARAIPVRSTSRSVKADPTALITKAFSSHGTSVKSNDVVIVGSGPSAPPPAEGAPDGGGTAPGPVSDRPDRPDHPE